SVPVCAPADAAGPVRVVDASQDAESLDTPPSPAGDANARQTTAGDSSARSSEPVAPLPIAPAPSASTGLLFAAVAAPVGIGALGTVQTAINNRCGAHYGSFLIGTWVSFCVGTLVLLVACGIEARVKGLPFVTVTPPPKVWQLVGGVLGVTNV